MIEQTIEAVQKEILSSVLEETKRLAEHYFDKHEDYSAAFNKLTGLRIALSCVTAAKDKLLAGEEVIDV